MDQPTQVNWLDTTPDERTMATLAHALQLIGAWIAPLIIHIVVVVLAGHRNRQSPYPSIPILV